MVKKEEVKTNYIIKKQEKTDLHTKSPPEKPLCNRRYNDINDILKILVQSLL